MDDFANLTEAPPEKLLETWDAFGRAALASGPNELRQALIAARMATMTVNDLVYEDERKVAKRILDDVRALLAHELRALVYRIFFSDNVFLEMVSWVTGEDAVAWESLSEEELIRICEMYVCVMLTRETPDYDWVLDLFADREGSGLELMDVRPTKYRSIYSDMSPDLADALQQLWTAESRCSMERYTPENVGALLHARALITESYSMHFAERIAVLAWCVLSYSLEAAPHTGLPVEEGSHTEGPKPNRRHRAVSSPTATSVITNRRGTRSNLSEHDVFMESITTEMAELLGVSEQMGEHKARRVRFVVPGKRRILRLRVRVVTQGNRRIEVCLVSTGTLPHWPEPYPSGLSLVSWEYRNQILTGFQIPFPTLNYVSIRPIISGALEYLTRYAASLS